MATNGSELFLDRATRIRKIQQIAQFLASIENKDPQVNLLAVYFKEAS